MDGLEVTTKECPNCETLTNNNPEGGYIFCDVCNVYFHVNAEQEDNIAAYYSSGEYRKKNQQPDEIKHQKRRANNIVGYIDPAPKNFVDIGCSAGVLMQVVKDRFGSNVYGVDIDTVLAHGVYRDISEVPVSPDCVAMIHTLEHMSRPLHALKNVCGKMTSGGQIIIEVPNGDRQSGRFYSSMFIFPHLVMFGKDSLAWTMERAGFDITSCVIHGDGGVVGAEAFYYLLMTGIKPFIKS